MKRPKFTPDHAEVIEHKKYHFTVTPIADLQAWKAEQARLEAQWEAGRQKRYENAKNAAMRVMEGGKRSEGQEELERIEAAYKATRRAAKNKPAEITWEMIQKKMDWHNKNEAANPNNKLGEHLRYRPENHGIALSEPKPSLFQRVKSAIAKFCKEAFPS